MQSELGSSFEEIVEPHYWSAAASVKARLATFDDDNIAQSDVVATDGTWVGGVDSTPPQPVEPFSDSYKIAATIRPSEESFSKGGEDAPAPTMDTDSQILIDNRCIVTTGTPEDQWVAPFSDSNELDAKSGCGEASGDSSCDRNGAAAQGDKRALPPKGPPGRFAAAAPFRTPGDILRSAALTVHAAVKITRAERLKRRAKWATKKLIVFILSHVGLTTVVGLYAVAGGFLFQYLEGQRPALNEHSPVIEVTETLEDNFNFTEIRQRHVDALWNYTYEVNVLRLEDWRSKADIIMKLFESDLKKVIIAPQNVTIAVADKWTYPSALLFSVTIITTIGYGDTVPVTLEGKVATMLYAVIGIPLVLLCLTNIGSFLATLFRFTWKHTTHLLNILLRSPKRNEPMLRTSEVRVPITVCVLTMVIYILSGAIIFSRWEHWSFLDGYYFCFITLSTIGFGDFVPGKNTSTLDSNAKRVVCALYLIFGLALLSMIFQLIQDSFTVIVRRYASFLGLSEHQIEKAMEESEHTADEDKGKKIIPNGGDPEVLPGMHPSAKLPVRRESCPVQMHDVPYTEKMARAFSLPANHPTRQLRLLRNKQLASGALESVQEPDPDNEPEQDTDHQPVNEKKVLEDIKETLYQKYCISSNDDDAMEPQ